MVDMCVDAQRALLNENSFVMTANDSSINSQVTMGEGNTKWNIALWCSHWGHGGKILLHGRNNKQMECVNTQL